MYGQGADSWKDTERDAAEGSEDIRPRLDARGSRPKVRGQDRKLEDEVEVRRRNRSQKTESKVRRPRLEVGRQDIRRGKKLEAVQSTQARAVR